MNSLMAALNETDIQKTYRESFENLRDVVKHHVAGSHITQTFGDGTSRRIEVQWISEFDQFNDPGNNIWLRYRDGNWRVDHRHPNRPVITALIEEANYFARRDCFQRMWHMYWMLILQDRTSQYKGDGMENHYDLHISPFNESDWIHL